jgi:hypothetical protein
MKKIWKNKTVVSEGKKCVINGLNIWDFKWEYTGHIITVKDPLYKKPHSCMIYEIRNGDIIAKFGAAEFSNSIYGIYVEKQTWF